MKDTLVTYPTSKIAKDKGFLEDAFYHYTGNGFLMENCVYNKNLVVTHHLYANSYDFEINRWGGGDVNCIAAPTQSALQKWIRDVHHIHIEITYMDDVLLFGYKLTEMISNTEHIEVYADTSNSPDHKGYTFEEAMESALQDALKLIKL